MEKLKKAFVDLGRSLCECAKAFSEMWDSISESLRIPLKIIEFPNCRIKHLALHGRKARTRKKNLKRLLRECEKDG